MDPARRGSLNVNAAEFRDAEFRDMLERLVHEGQMTSQQRDDLLEQKGYFDQHRTEIEQQYRYRVVGYVSGTREVGGTVHEVLNRAKERFPGRMVYLEPIGKELFGEMVKEKGRREAV
jgi:hypothetical protein